MADDSLRDDRPGPAGETPATPEKGEPSGGPGRVRRWLLRPFAWGLVLLLALVAGAWYFAESAYAKRRVMALVVARLSETLGRDVEVGAIDYGLGPLDFEMRDVVIPGRKPGDPPFAVVPRLRIQASWRALRQRVIDLQQIEVERPRIYAEFAPDGTTNIPQIRSQGGGKSRFEVRIGHILVEGGTLRLNEQKLPLELDARAVWGRLVGRGTNRFDALLTAQELAAVLPGARPYRGAVSVKGGIEPGRIRIASVRLSGPDLALRTVGAYEWRGEDKRLGLGIEVDGAAAIANRLGYLEEPIVGPFSFRGRFDLANDVWRWGGRLTSPRVRFLTRDLSDVEAVLAGTPAGLDVDVERARYAGGKIEGTVGVDLAGEAEGNPVALDFTFADLDLRTVLRDQEVPLEGVAGSGRGRFRYRFRTDAPLAGSGRAEIHLAGARSAGTGTLPISGDVPLTIERGVVTIPGARLSAPSLVLTGGGSIGLESLAGSFDYRLQTTDLAVLGRLLPPPAKGEPAPVWLPTAGTGTAAGTVRIDRRGFAVETAFDLARLATPGFAADTLAGSLRFRPGAVEDLRATATRGDARLAVAGRVPLPQDGRIAPGERLSLTASVDGWPAADLAGLAPGAPALGGRVFGRVDVGGTFERLDGRAALSVANLEVSGAAVGQATVEVAFDGPRIEVERASVATPAGTLQASGRLDRAAETVDFRVQAPDLDLAAEPFRTWVGGQLAGRAALHAAIAGPLAKPDAQLTLRGTGLALGGRPLGEAGAAQVVARWDGERVQAEGSLLGLATFSGGGRLDRRGADLGFDLASSNLQGLLRLATAQPLPGFAGGFQGRVTFAADFAEGSGGGYRGELALPTFQATYEGKTIHNLEPVLVELRPDRLTIRSFYLGEAETGTEFFASGNIGLGGESTPLDLRLQSTISTAWAELFAPQLDLSGYVDVLATVRGTTADPLVSGQGELRGARLILPNFPSALEDLRGTVLFYKDQIVLDNLSTKVGGGTVRASGRMAMPEAGKDLEYNVQVIAQDLAMRYPEGFVTRGGATLSLVSSPGGRQIRGVVDLRRAFYLEDVELGTFQLLQRVFQRERLEVEDTDEFLATTSLSIAIRGPGALRVRNNVADLRGDIDLTVRGSAARPVVFGQVEIEQGGKLVYADNEYRIERGLITFANPYRIDPVIDLVATTEVQKFDITLNLSGTLDRLDASFSTEAGLADLDVLALLATGKELEGEGGRLLGPGEQGAPQGSGGATGFLAGQAASALSKRVGNLFGFDRFRIEPLSGTTGESISSVQLTVGKRLSRTLFVTYTTNPSSTRGDLVQAEWQVGRNVVLVFTRNGDNTYSVDAQWERRY